MVSKYRTYNNTELLSLVANKRHQSPIIDELCRRLEELEDQILPESDEEISGEITCPICEATLKLSEID